MRDPKRDPHVRSEQLEQDSMHADIISMLFTGQSRRDQSSLRANLSLRFPDISPRQLRAAQEMAARGIALRAAVERAIKEGEPRQEGDASPQK